MTPLFLIDVEALLTESLDFPAMITTRTRAATLVPAVVPSPVEPPANKDDLQVDRAAPAAHDPPTSLT